MLTLRRKAVISCTKSTRHISNTIRHKSYWALAIETSCDDTAVAIVRYRNNAGENGMPSSAIRHTVDVCFHEKKTANNDDYRGIHPLVALQSHRTTLAPLIKKAIREVSTRLSDHADRLPREYQYRDEEDPAQAFRDQLAFVAVTRGPGMRSNLSVGLDTAKGLALAFDVPLLGVHHMQAHALTPRLMTAIYNAKVYDRSTSAEIHLRNAKALEPDFPFLSVLISGGHTLLLDSMSLTEHHLIAETQDIALGDFLDKAARAIVPPEQLKPPYGRALEHFAFQSCTTSEERYEVNRTKPDNSESFRTAADGGRVGYQYVPPARRQEELERRPSEWGWSLAPPLSESKGGDKSSRRMVYSFAGLLTSIERIMKYKANAEDHTIRDERTDVGFEERRHMAREVQRVAFEHLASRILLYLKSTGSSRKGDTIVVSGGVASNQFLRHVLRSILHARGYRTVKLSFPPIELCTDNALMIAWWVESCSQPRIYADCL